jgi:hypothetical protein
MTLPEPAVILPLACFNNIPRKKFPTKLQGGSLRGKEAPCLIHLRIRHRIRIEP